MHNLSNSERGNPKYVMKINEKSPDQNIANKLTLNVVSSDPALINNINGTTSPTKILQHALYHLTILVPKNS